MQPATRARPDMIVMPAAIAGVISATCGSAEIVKSEPARDSSPVMLEALAKRIRQAGERRRAMRVLRLCSVLSRRLIRLGRCARAAGRSCASSGAWSPAR